MISTKTNKPVVALIAAAGMGTRLGAEVPKAYVELQGRTLLDPCVVWWLYVGALLGVWGIIVLVLPSH